MVAIPTISAAAGLQKQQQQQQQLVFPVMFAGHYHQQQPMKYAYHTQRFDSILVLPYHITHFLGGTIHLSPFFLQPASPSVRP